jgi:hypothetical protein
VLDDSVRVRMFRRFRDGLLHQAVCASQRQRAMHPVRTVKRAVTPKPVKKLQRSLHPVSDLEYSVQRSIATSLRPAGKRKAKVYTHGNCPIRHRTPDAAARCRNR